jgi:hypothetical protein
MFRRLLMVFFAGKIFRMIGNRSRGHSYRQSGWGSRHNTSLSHGLNSLFGRRRRSMI